MQGLGCAVAADKGEVPVLLMKHYISIHDEDKREAENQSREKQCQPAGGPFHAIASPDPRYSPNVHQNLLIWNSSTIFVVFSTHHVRTVSIRRCRSLFLHRPLARRDGLTSHTPTLILPFQTTSRDPIDFGLLKH